MVRLRPLLWPTLISLPILVLCLALSVWQMERREWKRDILDRIGANQSAAPIALDALLSGGDPLRREYGKVAVSGTFLHDKEFHLAARSRGNDVGIQVVTPLRTDKGQIEGTVKLVGVVRRTQVQRQFTPDNVPDKNVWFTVDVPLMRTLAGGRPDPALDTFFLEADANHNPGGLPIGGQTQLDIPNDHLQYAITWFLLALALIGVYLSYHWENGRLTVNGKTKVKTP